MNTCSYTIACKSSHASIPIFGRYKYYCWDKYIHRGHILQTARKSEVAMSDDTRARLIHIATTQRTVMTLRSVALSNI